MNTRARLDIAYEEGQLGADEYHDRSGRAAAAETLAQLHSLVADLQASPGSADLGLPRPESLRTRHRGEYPAGVRARDEDRAAACVILDAALGDGQLSVDDHRTLTELAGAAKTLGDLADLTGDLQRPVGAPAEPRRPRSRRGWFAAGAAVVVVCAAVAGFSATHRSAATPDVALGAEPAQVQPLVVPMPELTTADGFALVRERYRAKFGGTVVDELTLFPGYALVEAAPAGQPNRVVRWDYRGGFMPSGDPTTRPVGTATFDLAAVDPAVLGRLLAEAPGLLRVEGGAVSHVSFETDTISHAPQISIYAGNSFDESGYLETTPAGDMVRVSPFGG